MLPASLRVSSVAHRAQPQHLSSRLDELLATHLILTRDLRADMTALKMKTGLASGADVLATVHDLRGDGSAGRPGKLSGELETDRDDPVSYYVTAN